MLDEVMETARTTMAKAGADIIGGHTAIGAELTIGFTVFGKDAVFGLAGAQVGDAVILTKPVGTGVIMAAEMGHAAPGDVVLGALNSMQVSQRAASAVLRHVATAMTDVTGFGLLGHLDGLCAASGVGADLSASEVPLLHGALALSTAGHRSSLFEKNRALFPLVDASGAHALLFDPQTSGGLLATLPDAKAEDTVSTLCARGVSAAKIGQITSATGVRVV